MKELCPELVILNGHVNAKHFEHMVNMFKLKPNITLRSVGCAFPNINFAKVNNITNFLHQIKSLINC